MKLRDFVTSCEIQSEVKYCYYDYANDTRVEESFDELADCEVRFVYVEDSILFLEVSKEDFN